jgi:peptide/nickel transport system ATP-binding protein
MVFQEPMKALSPVHTVGSQIVEMVHLHQSASAAEARRRAVQMLRRVGIPRAEERFESYPFQLSGGMRQRAIIAMALICEPDLLIADEPTTALDATTQASILDLMNDLQREMGMAVLFITHDLGVVAEIADRVAVMYLGAVVESAPVEALFHDPKHPYAQDLLRSIPRVTGERGERLATIEGMVPHPTARPPGCPFHPRCRESMPGTCDRIEPPSEDLGPERRARCLLYSNIDAIEDSASPADKEACT